jgi:hypothetical protein
MKHTLFVIALISFVSCTKKPNCDPLINQQHSRVNKGCWASSYGSLCFTDSLMSVDRQPFYPYFLSTDSIYYLLDDGSKFAQYGYALVNDTLRLYPTLHHPNAPFTYWR